MRVPRKERLLCTVVRRAIPSLLPKNPTCCLLYARRVRRCPGCGELWPADGHGFVRDRIGFQHEEVDVEWAGEEHTVLLKFIEPRGDVVGVKLKRRKLFIGERSVRGVQKW